MSTELDTGTLFTALRRVGRMLGLRFTYERDGAYHFHLGCGQTIRVCEDSGGRLRLTACVGTRVGATLWCDAQDYRRLALVVQELNDGVRVAA